MKLFMTELLKVLNKLQRISLQGQRRIIKLLLLVLLSSPSLAYAAGCEVSTSASYSPTFGSVSSINVNKSTQTTSLPEAGIRCGGSLLSVLALTSYIRGTVTSTGLLTNGTDTIPFQMFVDSSFSRPFTSGTAFNYYNSTILGLLGLTGESYNSIPMYFRTITGALNLKAGTYTGSVSVYWEWSICSAINITLLCIGTVTTDHTTVTINLTLNVTNDCVITAPDINFGIAPLASSFGTVTQTISVYCTKGTVYTVGLGNGSHALNNQRRLAYNGNYLNYEIYQGNTGTLRWGALLAERRAAASAEVNPGLGSGVNTTKQGFLYRATILSNQTTPPAGTYTDSVVVDVQF
ncbi:Csu type fimbrial protein [Zophobihabitans entericus]|uniref:Spore coat U domain-containing protein n=1 Tax=Zophobihabitans entericus TaxID=1635327 RepID=A0A6G9IA97_9GAMM|nr:spore coat U domain-containing protein [Zophobihabitans entericus]QIQ20757.1 spore coat U domain-containing protein [Zophobihabitans entericus]